MIDIEIIEDTSLEVDVLENGDVSIDILTDNATDIDISSVGAVSVVGQGEQSLHDLLVSGDILMTLGLGQTISFANGVSITMDDISIPYDTDLTIGKSPSGNGNVKIGKAAGGTVTIMNDLDVAGVAIFEDYAYFRGDLGTEVFVSGFAGSGWKMDFNTDYSLTVDNLTVRKAMKVYELIINQIRSTNGSLWVSDAAKIESVDGNDCYIDTDQDTIAQPFVVDDILRCQKWTGRGIKYYSAQVTAVDPNGEYFTVTVIDGTDAPAAGDTVVRVGNATDTDRQGALYLTSSDDNAPYLDVLDGVTSYSFTGKNKIRLGRLDGITDADFGGELTGYGLYAQNVYLKGQLVIAAGTTGYDNITDKPDLDTLLGDLQSQIDGQIMQYFYDYVPSLINLPASDWTTDELKNNHLGDLFYNTASGLAYRFSKIGAVYSWELVPDNGVAEALAAAAAAQDTADGKRRVFVTEPVPPYDVGDLWVDGTDLFRCSTARASGSYVAGDFVLATSYTEGATWGTNLNGIPPMLGTPSGTGLFLSSTHMGYYTGGAWKTYIDNSGNFLFGNIAGGGTGISWNQGTGVLNIKGIVTITSGSGYSTLSDKPTSLSGINATEGAKLNGIATGADVTQTVINGGLVTTGRLEVGPGGYGSAVAGISGSGSSSTSIRFWAGVTFASSVLAPFRVQQDGKMYASSGAIGGWSLDSNAIYHGVKKTSDGFSTDGITLCSDGSLHAERFYINSNGNIGFNSGSATGKRVVIDSVNNRIDIYNNSNINIIRIDDSLNDDLPIPGIMISNPSDVSYNGSLTSTGLYFWGNASPRFGISVYPSETQFMIKNLPTHANNSGDWGFLKYRPSTGEIYYNTTS